MRLDNFEKTNKNKHKNYHVSKLEYIGCKILEKYKNVKRLSISGSLLSADERSSFIRVRSSLILVWQTYAIYTSNAKCNADCASIEAYKENIENVFCFRRTTFLAEDRSSSVKMIAERRDLNKNAVHIIMTKFDMCKQFVKNY